MKVVCLLNGVISIYVLASIHITLGIQIGRTRKINQENENPLTNALSRACINSLFEKYQTNRPIVQLADTITIYRC